MANESSPQIALAEEHTKRLFIGGSWIRPANSLPHLDVTDASTGRPLRRIVQGDDTDVNDAVEAAADAWRSWSRTSLEERATLLDEVAAQLEKRRDDIATMIALEVGTPMRVATAVQAGLPVQVLRGFSAALREHSEERIGNSILHRQPVGVVAAITPWNYPLHQVVAKVGAALAAGCSTVLKPSNVAPLSAFALAEIFEEIELPAGLFNLVPGQGALVGEALATHPGVHSVSFTGSTGAGAHVASLAAKGLRRISLELGGKSASIVLPGADLGTAVKASVRNAFLNSGQTCSAWTRLLVPASELAEVENLVQADVANLTVGHPLATTTRLGPMASVEQQNSVKRYIASAEAAGLRKVATAPMDRDNDPNGYYVEPVVYSDVPRNAKIAREEVFGPVLSILTYSGVDDAVALANSSEYGLAGGVWGPSDDEALTVARQLRTGQVDVNGAPFNPTAPFGGFGHSGWGRELGAHGIEEFLETTAIQVRST